MGASIYIADDEKNIRDLITKFLESDGYSVTAFETGDELMEEFLKKPCELVILDIMMPGTDGLTICRQLRTITDVPIIMLTAKDSEYDYVRGITLGGDDYLTKPFDIDELALRVAAVLRRLRPDFGKCAHLQFRDITLDNEAKRVFVSGNEVAFTAMEYAILELMLEHPGQIFSKARLFETVCGEDYISGDNTIHVHMSNIRKKLANVSDSEYIETVYGMGYRLADAPRAAL